METQSHKQLVAESEDFKVWVEPSSGVTAYLHCEVSKFTPSVLKIGYRVFAEVEHQAKEAGYISLVTITPNPKFAKLFGGETVGALTYEDKEYEVVVWELQKQL